MQPIWADHYFKTINNAKKDLPKQTETQLKDEDNKKNIINSKKIETEKENNIQ